MNDPRYKNLDSHHPKRISYILTTKNHAGYLDDALKVARQLVTKDDELIVVDGASSDSTLEILDRYKDSIDILVSEPDENPSHALNKGILLARGKYIKQLCDDDDIYSEAMERVITILENYPDVDFLVCGHERQYWYSPEISYRYLPPGVNYGARPEDAFKYKASGSAFVIRRRVFAKVGLSPTNFVADSEFTAQCIARGGVVKFCRIILGKHNILKHSFTQTQWEKANKQYFEAIRKYCSTPFYVHFKLKRLFRRHWWGVVGLIMMRVLGWPRLLYDLWRREGFGGVKNKIGYLLKHGTVIRKEELYIWDGGFS